MILEPLDEDDSAYCDHCGRTVEQEDMYGFSEIIGTEVCYDCVPDEEGDDDDGD